VLRNLTQAELVFVTAMFRVFNGKFEAYHRPDNPKGVMSTWDRAAIWDNRADAEAVVDELNERDRQPEYGELVALVIRLEQSLFPTTAAD
jgi:hypothetical protein